MASSLTVENNVLSGDPECISKMSLYCGDHGIYAIGVRKILAHGNTFENHGDSVVKLLPGGFAAGGVTVCDTGEYSSWVVDSNHIRNSSMAMAAYLYCATKLPLLAVTNNVVTHMYDNHAANGATFYLQANCQSEFENIRMSGNVVTDIQLGGVILYSSQQGAPCADPGHARGAIGIFSSRGDRYVNWSQASPGSYAAISSGAGGPPTNLLRASVSQLTTDGMGNGRSAFNLLAFRQVTLVDNVENTPTTLPVQ